MKIRTTALLPLALTLGASANAQNIVELAESTGRFNVLVAALEATGLDAVLEGTQDFTVFAPTDYAFQTALGADGINNLLANPDVLSQILLYHVVPGIYTATDVVAVPYLTTAFDQRIDISVAGGMVSVDDSLVQYTDLFASNGVVHVIDSPLIPNLDDLPAAADYLGRFDTLLTAVVAAGLDQALAGPGPFTVFAPTDYAFDALPAGTVERLLLPGNQAILTDILQYHVVPGRLYAADVAAQSTLTTLNNKTIDVTVQGGEVFLDAAKVIFTDWETTNGNIHVLDGVLIP